MKYNAIGPKTKHEVESAISGDNPEELSQAVLSAALYSEDPLWAESICIQLARHAHENVRGNAILGFGHIARIHRHLNSSEIKPLIETALKDGSDYVRGHAESAADDVEFFLKWTVSRP
jgi:hypothetical protein